jgi:hypothetical protein
MSYASFIPRSESLDRIELNLVIVTGTSVSARIGLLLDRLHCPPAVPGTKNTGVFY